MAQRTGQRGHARTVSVVAIAALALALGRLAAVADPMPSDEPWLGGRITPAQAVPVDMVAEALHVEMKPAPMEDRQRRAYVLCKADVVADYVLRADGSIRVPVVFPIVNGASDLTFTLSDRDVPTQVVADLDLFEAYEAAWRREIDGYVSDDPGLQNLADEATRLMERARRRVEERRKQLEEKGWSTDHTRMDTLHISSLLGCQLDNRLHSLGWSDTSSLVWGLCHYLKDDWDETYGPRPDEKDADPDMPRHVRLWTERELAVSLDPECPDPVALWDMPEIMPMSTSMVFAVANLELHEGDNELSVRYTQPTAFVSRRPSPEKPHEWTGHQLVCDFVFVLRTARFWRSFGDLSIDIALPKGTVFAQCSLPGAKIEPADQPRRVTYAGHGVPEQNLSVQFTTFHPLEHEPVRPYQAAAQATPTAELPLLWDAVVTDEGGFSHAPPVADENVVVAAVEGHGVVCNRRSGRILRRFAFDGTPGQLLLLRDKIVVGTDRSPSSYTRYASVTCLDRLTGGQSWVADCRGQGPPHLLVAGHKIVAWVNYSVVFAVNLDDGTVAWQGPKRCRAVALSPEARMGQEDGLVYCACVRTLKRHSTPGHAPGAVGVVVALRLADGQTAWERELRTSVVGLGLADGSLYAVGHEGTYSKPFVACLRPADGELLWKESLAEQCPPFNCIYHVLKRGDRLLVIGDDGVVAFDIAPPIAKAWELRLPGQARFPAVLVGDFAYANCYEGLFKADLRSGAWVWKAPRFGRHPRGPFNMRDGQILMVQTFGGLLTAWSEKPTPPAQSPTQEVARGAVPADLVNALTSAVRIPLPTLPKNSIYSWGAHDLKEANTEMLTPDGNPPAEVAR